jgi:hypothetical protein
VFGHRLSPEHASDGLHPCLDRNLSACLAVRAPSRPYLSSYLFLIVLFVWKRVLACACAPAETLTFASQFCFDRKKYKSETWEVANTERSSWVCPACRGVCPCPRCFNRLARRSGTAVKSAKSAPENTSGSGADSGSGRKRPPTKTAAAAAAEQRPLPPTPQLRVEALGVLDKSSLDAYVKDSLADLDQRMDSSRRTLADAELLVVKLKAAQEDMKAERVRLRGLWGDQGAELLNSDTTKTSSDGNLQPRESARRESLAASVEEEAAQRAAKRPRNGSDGGVMDRLLAIKVQA